MTQDAEPRYVQRTLDWCNRQRAKKGMPPLDRLPRGEMSNSSSCPCGAATGLVVESYEHYEPGFAEDAIPNPGYLRRFIEMFDGGRLPQYVAPVGDD